MYRKRVLLIGDFAGREFAPVAELLTAQCEISRAADVDTAVRHLAATPLALEVAVLAWPLPGMYTARQIFRLRKAAPLARQLAVLGSWCEGEARSGQPVAGMIRTMWHQWLPRWADEFRPRRGKRTPDWSLPETTTDDERLLALPRRPRQTSAGLIAIVSRNHDVADLYGDACRQQGFSTAWLTQADDLVRVAQPAAVVWDAHPRCIGEIEALRAQTSSPILALLDFPRGEEMDQARRAGADAVLARPLLLDSFHRELERLIKRPLPQRRVA